MQTVRDFSIRAVSEHTEPFVLDVLRLEGDLYCLNNRRTGFLFVEVLTELTSLGQAPQGQRIGHAICTGTAPFIGSWCKTSGRCNSFRFVPLHAFANHCRINSFSHA